MFEKMQFSRASVEEKIAMLIRVGSEMFFERVFNMNCEKTDWLMAVYANCISDDGMFNLIG